MNRTEPVPARELAMRLTHQFNNLLTVMVGGTSLLKEELLTAAVPANAVASTPAPGEHRTHEDDDFLVLKQVVEDMESASLEASRTLDLLSLWARQGLQAASVTAIESVVEQALADIGRTCPEHIQLLFDGNPESPQVEVDAAALRVVLSCLVRNSIEALVSSTRPGTITISSHRYGPDDDLAAGGAAPGCEIRIADDGEGMFPDIVARACEPFFTTRRDTGRNGMGLAAAAGFVERHGGRLSIESEPDRGTVVSLLLPTASPGC